MFFAFATLFPNARVLLFFFIPIKIKWLALATAQDLSADTEKWKGFLTTAGRLYRYPFIDQLLIYAQRPDATACAELETWNQKMNCWVNRGSKGIALLDESSGRPS